MKIYKLSNTQSIHLWLDDNRDPSDPIYQQKFGAHGNEIWAKTVPEAITILEQGNVISISFDNDLGEKLEGYDLAKWIEEKAHDNQIKPLQWKIHSANPEGKRYIEVAMNQAEKFWKINLEKENKESNENKLAEPLNQKSYQERYDRWSKSQ